ncbi:Endonuclease/Exonuclease/phosphatase_family protein [Hexamita inflata]|uniref:Endonuclease/Exonuclease/phosphatase family protein n=1 Tax=Hexamita inflata TaxID=28002 RepID=A0AA86NI83_9EUKA|nr:Endonuclease/Exonuclease/phosphatase family protein [Hexamita inflata]
MSSSQNDRPKTNQKHKIPRQIQQITEKYTNQCHNIPINQNDQLIQQSQPKKIIAYNVNGLRASIEKKNLELYIKQSNADIIFIGETKIGQNTITQYVQQKQFVDSYINQEYYYLFSSSVAKQGYAGTAAFIRKSVNIINFQTYFATLGNDCIINTEGRLIRLELQNLVIYHVYSPQRVPDSEGTFNGRIKIEEKIRFQVKSETKPVIYCGDLNICLSELDLFDWKKHLQQLGISEEMRSILLDKVCLQLMKENQLVDCFRTLHPQLVKYSWFKNSKLRELNKGWRIDYFLVSQQLVPQISECDIDYESQINMDHLPIILILL